MLIDQLSEISEALNPLSFVRLFCKTDRLEPIPERLDHICTNPEDIHRILIMRNEHIGLFCDATHALGKPSFPEKKCVVRPKFHWHCPVLQPLLRPKILVHHASTIEILCGHAHFTVDTFLRINIIAIPDDGDRPLPTDRLTLKTLSASVKLPNLVADHPL